MILIATDLDRTLLPDGPYPDDKSIDNLFVALSNTQYILAYVTGRNLSLVQDAQKKYDIPTPDYLIAEVGTKIFHKEENTLVPDILWTSYIRAHEPRWNRNDITDAIGTAHDITMQEDWKQNEFKISYYLPKSSDKNIALRHIHKSLEHIGITSDVLYSFDPLKNNIGLIDILPKTATKATALEFIRERAHLAKDEVVYCGDSGNDILPLTNGYRAILVKNAPENVQKDASKRLEKLGIPKEKLYIAHGDHGQNGNYASGIIEGLRHFGIIS
ncbi:hypothetical protein MNBD_CPR01-435 [hydrothermal vent metagenome]|uniref:Sucrose phosphatase-like domain-containing protein n=1 Tax=hydrothermal vent metagenome TaxID=652676 RepID=A0A3B0V0G9_9ZZZZ